MIRCLEHLELDKPEQSEIKETFKNAKFVKFLILTILKFWKNIKSNQEGQINEAIFIKSQATSLNKKLFNKGSLYNIIYSSILYIVIYIIYLLFQLIKL